MKRRIVAAFSTVFALSLALAGCAGGSEPKEPGSPSDSPSESAGQSPTVDEEPAANQSATSASGEDFNALVSAEWTSIVGVAAGDLNMAIEDYGADAVYVSLVISDNYSAFAAIGQESAFDDPSAMLESGYQACTEISNGMTLDEIYMGVYEAMGITSEQDPNFMFSELIWSVILNGPTTICPEHAQVLADWEASLH